METAELQRHPVLGNFNWIVEFRGHHADHFPARAIQTNDSIKNRRIAAKAPLPQTVAEDDYRRDVLRLLFVCCKDTAQQRRDSERFEQAGRDSLSPHPLGRRLVISS